MLAMTESIRYFDLTLKGRKRYFHKHDDTNRSKYVLKLFLCNLSAVSSNRKAV